MYKRQAHENARVKGRHVPGARVSGHVAVADGVRAVSHTHLDVYKRQAFNVVVVRQHDGGLIPHPGIVLEGGIREVHAVRVAGVCLLYTSRCV